MKYCQVQGKTNLCTIHVKENIKSAHLYFADKFEIKRKKGQRRGQCFVDILYSTVYYFVCFD